MVGDHMDDTTDPPRRPCLADAFTLARCEGDGTLRPSDYGARSREQRIAHLGSALRRALCAAALIAGPAFAQERSELVDLINAYRTAPQTCDGRRAPAAGPLAPDAALASVRIGSGGDVRSALKARGYLAARALAIRVSGPATPSEAMRFMQQRYCRSLLSSQYAEIGISRDKDTWHIVLAQPLLASNLGDWREAGKEILRLTNAARAEPRTCGGRRFEAAPPLAWTTELAAAALVHSRDMANRNYFDHRGKDGSHVGGRATREGYVWRRVGENIAAGQGSPEQVVSGWLSSPHHCGNVMNPDFAEMGAAFAMNPASDNTIYWTQVFGTPR